MATPRAGRAKTTSEMGQESPTRGQLVPGCTITSELYVILEAHDIDEDEASNVAADRLNTMGHELEVAGYPRNMTSAVIQLEWYVRDLVSKWRNEVARTGSRRTLSEWALRQMTTTDFTMVPNVEDLEMQVRGLSRLAGLTYEEATMAIQRAWSASTAGMRSHMSPADVSTGQAASPGVDGPAASKTSAAAGGAVEPLAPAGSGGGSPGDGFSTPRQYS